ncbi:MAG: hypothetical protein WDN03_07920 [Rhizomicrobium sp.]
MRRISTVRAALLSRLNVSAGACPRTQTSLLAAPDWIDSERAWSSCATRTSPPGITI